LQALFVGAIAVVLCLSLGGTGWNAGSDTATKLRSRSQEELAQGRSAISQQRDEAIAALLAIVRDATMRKENIPAVRNAVDILGEIRAMEASGDLLEMVNFHRAGGEMGGGPLGRLWSTNPGPEELGNVYPCVRALIKIGVGAQQLIDRIRTEEHVFRQRCYVAVLRGIHGDEMALTILQKAIEKETDARKINRLKGALQFFERKVRY
jgi:hypothetical protein